MAAAVWRALGQPRTLRDLVDLFAAAFPNVEREVLRRDLRVVLGRMRKVRLVVVKSESVGLTTEANRQSRPRRPR